MITRIQSRLQAHLRQVQNMVPRQKLWLPLYRSRNGVVPKLHIQVFLLTTMVIIGFWEKANTYHVDKYGLSLSWDYMSLYLVWTAVTNPRPDWSQGECRTWLHDPNDTLSNTLIRTGDKQLCKSSKTHHRHIRYASTTRSRDESALCQIL